MRKTILHFSENELARTSRQMTLTTAGYSVFSADSEIAALSLAELEPCYALIVCFSVAPERGRRIAEALRVKHEDVLVVAFGDQHRPYADVSINEFLTAGQWLEKLSSVFASQMSGLLSLKTLATIRMNRVHGIHVSMKHWKTLKQTEILAMNRIRRIVPL